MFNQKEGVYQAVVSVVGPIESNHVSVDKSTKARIADVVTEMFVNGEISLSPEASAKYNTREKLRSDYVPGLVDNWLRKDTRLNGGEKYKTKNPGSRAGSGDEVLKNLRALKSTIGDASQKEVIQAEIDKRLAEIAASKAKTVEVDYSKIPDDLKAKLGIE